MSAVSIIFQHKHDHTSQDNEACFCTYRNAVQRNQDEIKECSAKEPGRNKFLSCFTEPCCQAPGQLWRSSSSYPTKNEDSYQTHGSQGSWQWHLFPPFFCAYFLLREKVNNVYVHMLLFDFCDDLNVSGDVFQWQNMVAATSDACMRWRKENNISYNK